MDQLYFVYILTNAADRVFYTGSSNDLKRRVYEHKTKAISNSFTARYNVNKLVYYEVAESMEAAILRERQIKAGSRADKVRLIREMNPEWQDLYDSLE